MIQGTCILQVDGQDYTVQGGDMALAPPNAKHEWRGNGDQQAAWLVINPV